MLYHSPSMTILFPYTTLFRSHVLEPLERDFRAFHLADERGVGERVEEGERLEVHAIGLSGEEQRVGLDCVEHRGRRADRKSTRLNSSHLVNSYAVFCLKKITYYDYLCFITHRL